MKKLILLIIIIIFTQCSDNHQYCVAIKQQNTYTTNYIVSDSIFKLNEKVIVVCKPYKKPEINNNINLFNGNDTVIDDYLYIKGIITKIY